MTVWKSYTQSGKERFSLENQIITPTMKIKRHVAKKIFEEEINKMYEI